MTSWLQNNLQPAIKLIGTIILAIGGIVTLSAAGRLAIWQPEPPSTYAGWCEHRGQTLMEVPLPYEASGPTGTDEPVSAVADPEEQAACAASRQAEEKHRHTQNQLEGLVTGLSMALVGGALVLTSRRRES